MKQELPIVGIEANDIGRQHIDGEIRRELRNLSAVIQLQPFSAIACHETLRARSPHFRTPIQCLFSLSSSSRAGVSDAGVYRYFPTRLAALRTRGAGNKVSGRLRPNRTRARALESVKVIAKAFRSSRGRNLPTTGSSRPSPTPSRSPRSLPSHHSRSRRNRPPGSLCSLPRRSLRRGSLWRRRSPRPRRSLWRRRSRVRSHSLRSLIARQAVCLTLSFRGFHCRRDGMSPG